MKVMRAITIALLLNISIVLSVPTVLQHFEFLNFTDTSDQFNFLNSAEIDSDIMTLCPNKTNNQGQAWFINKVQVLGFTSTFTFRLSGGQGEGFTFIIQSSSTSASGNPGAGLGYADQSNGPSGIISSIAIEFDTTLNADMNDPNNNHVSVHARPAGTANSANENYSIASIKTLSLLPESQHSVTVTYTPQPPSFDQGQLVVTMSEFSGNLINVTFDMSTYVDLDYGNSAWIGFTAATGPAGSVQNHQILDWTFEFLGETSSNSVASGSGISAVSAGNLATVTVQGVDQFGNNMIIGGANFTANLSSEQIPFTWTDYNNGTYTVTYNTTIATSASNLSISLNGLPIKGSPFKVAVSPGSLYAPNCYAYQNSSQSGLTSGVAGVANYFLIQIKDVYNNTITTDPKVPINVTLMSIYGNTMGTATYTKNGIYSVKYLTTVATNWTLLISIGGSYISNHIFDIPISPNVVDPTRTYASGSGLTGGIVGTEISYIIQLVDAYNNTIYSNGSVNIAVTFTGPQSVTPVIKYNGNGQYKVSYAITESGKYRMSVTINKKNIMSSPFDLLLEPADTVDSSNCIMYGPQLNNTVAGNFSVFYVQLVDYFGNNITEEVPLEWEVTVTLNSTDYNATDCEVEYVDAGVFRVTYNVTISGQYILEARINGSDVGPNSMYSIQVVPAETYGPMCEAEGQGLTDTYTDYNAFFTITARDRYGNLRGVGGDNWTISITKEAKMYDIISLQDRENGTYSVTYKLADSGDYKIEIRLHDKQIQGSPFTVRCDWSGLPTWLVLTIGGSAAFVVVVGLVGFLLYKKKMKMRKEYTPIKDGSE